MIRVARDLVAPVPQALLVVGSYHIGKPSNSLPDRACLAFESGVVMGSGAQDITNTPLHVVTVPAPCKAQRPE